MPEPVFHFFEQLPQELQMHIWKYAATPETKLELNDYILRHIGRNRSSRTVETSSYHARFLKHTSATLLHRGIIFKMPESGSHANITATARTSLLGTCRLARQIVLETWKTDIQRISISGSNFDGQFARYQQKEAARKVVVKVELVVALQDLIAYVMAASLVAEEGD